MASRWLQTVVTASFLSLILNVINTIQLLQLKTFKSGPCYGKPTLKPIEASVIPYQTAFTKTLDSTSL